MPLLSNGTGEQISEVLTASTEDSDVLVNTLLSVNEEGALALLQQVPNIGVWETRLSYAVRYK